MSVVPHAGTWIEMGNIQIPTGGTVDVVPHAGTWIEMQSQRKDE